MTDRVQKEPGDEEISCCEEIVARRSAVLLQLAREALEEIDRPKSTRGGDDKATDL